MTATIRHAGIDDQVPLSKPLRSARDPKKTLSSIPIKKDQLIFVPIYAMNHSKAIFGEDADEFRPERWLESENGTGKKIEGGVGVWSHLLTFIAGPRSCIGYKVRSLPGPWRSFRLAIPSLTLTDASPPCCAHSSPSSN